MGTFGYIPTIVIWGQLGVVFNINSFIIAKFYDVLESPLFVKLKNHFFETDCQFKEREREHL